MADDDELLGDMKFDEELESFLSGKGGTVNLQPTGATAFSSPPQETEPLKEGSSVPASDGGDLGTSATAAAAAAAAAATAAAAAKAMIGGDFASTQNIIGKAVGNMAGAAVPTSLQPVKEQAGRFLSKAQPWREFVWPLSVPPAAESCSRLTANLYHFQTNYAILFVVQLVLAIILQPSALICIAVTVLVWMGFLKYNDDPDWKPKLGGHELTPWQRWLLLAALTALVLMFVAGSTIFNATLLFLILSLAHGVIHDTSGKAVPATGGGEVPL